MRYDGPHVGMSLDPAAFYTYLTHARRDLWGALEGLPDRVLAADVIPGARFRSIKDLLFHIPAGEDWWLHENILRDPPVWQSFPDLGGLDDARRRADEPLPRLLDYWWQVEASTLDYLGRLTPAELGRTVRFTVARGEVRFLVAGALWHVMQHEVRHTAQIALLVRQAGWTPPALDLDNYLLAGLVPDLSRGPGSG